MGNVARKFRGNPAYNPVSSGPPKAALAQISGLWPTGLSSHHHQTTAYMRSKTRARSKNTEATRTVYSAVASNAQEPQQAGNVAYTHEASASEANDRVERVRRPKGKRAILEDMMPFSIVESCDQMMSTQEVKHVHSMYILRPHIRTNFRLLHGDSRLDIITA